MLTYDEALEYIHSTEKVKKSEGHLAMKRLLARFGDPQDTLKYVHIAGTNGKGSCAAMSANVLKAAGYKVGMNISPYVIEFRERIQLNGEFIPKEDLVLVTDKVKTERARMKEEEGLELTEFEKVTSIAMIWFRMEKCDVVVLEVGVGGLYDCTNIIKDNLVACIMNIDFDHTRRLGNTLAEIAAHKAGIIKPGCPVVRYPAMKQEALDVIKQTRKDKKSELIVPPMGKIRMENTGFMKSRLSYGGMVVDQSFAGIHQSYNATVVIEAMRALRKQGYNITDEDIRKGIGSTVFPARIEVISESPLVILDGGHNIDGVSRLVKVLRENNIHDLTAVWASLRDKDPESIVKLISPYVKRLYTVPLHGNRALDSRILAEMAQRHIPESYAMEDVISAVDTARENMTDGGLLVFGSLYLAGDAREHLLELFR